MNLIRIVEMRYNRIFLITITLLLIFYLSINSLSTCHQSDLNIRNHSKPSLPRIYCLITTSPKYFDTRATAVNATWAPRCDKYTFISEYSNDTKGLPIAPIANITPGYAHLTQKTILAFHYVYENFINDFDWLVKADDDTYLFVENLKTFLTDKNTSLPITFGYNFKVHVPLGFHTGGAAYVLSQESLKRFYQAHQDPNTTCTKDGGIGEDVEIAKCLRSKGVYPGKSVDEFNRERFHHLAFSSHFRGKFDNWFIEYAENKPVSGPDCCSNSTISFHYVSPDEQYLIDRVRYGFHSKK